ncbi:MAG: hypothetical protein EA428_09180 [Spirochaetaceae bacterium]|nr:MAG: hypothetical protein EA428_09180 [Spirochaetaceae bacterium]
MTYALLLVGILFVGIVLFIRIRNHMYYCRKVSENGSGERIPGCPDFELEESETTADNGEEQQNKDQDG